MECRNGATLLLKGAHKGSLFLFNCPFLLELFSRCEARGRRHFIAWGGFFLYTKCFGKCAPSQQAVNNKWLMKRREMFPKLRPETLGEEGMEKASAGRELKNQCGSIHAHSWDDWNDRNRGELKLTTYILSIITFIWCCHVELLNIVLFFDIYCIL